MQDVVEMLQPGERIVYRARKRALAYVYPLMMFGLTLWPGAWSAMASTRLMLTDKRVVGTVGAYNKKTLNCPYAKIASTKVQRGPGGALFDYGTLTIIDELGKKVKFKGIAEPMDVKIQIDEAIEVAVLGRKLSQTVMEKW